MALSGSVFEIWHVTDRHPHRFMIWPHIVGHIIIQAPIGLVHPNLARRFPTLDATRKPVSRSNGHRSGSPGPLMLTHIVRHIFRMARPIQIVVVLPKLAGRYSMTRATLHTSFNVKRSKISVTRRLTQTCKMCHIFWTVRLKNFKDRLVCGWRT